MPELRTRQMPVLAQDPAVRRNGRILMARVSVPWEDLESGPIGHRVHVVDYDATTETFYAPAPIATGDVADPDGSDDVLGDPAFHARNVYALVMRTLARFEYALGRRVGWRFPAPQLKVVPHAFEEVNSFYSPDAEALLFGYYRHERGHVFMCLSHDVVVHETTHALLDGLRSRFMNPSSADQAAFHEGIADVVALLSVFSLGEVLRLLIDLDPASARGPKGLIRRTAVTKQRLMRSALLGLAEQMADESGSARASALRRSVKIEPAKDLLTRPEYRDEPHRRGEVLVSAMMRAFVEIWSRRLVSLGRGDGDYLDLDRVAEEGAAIAEILLTTAIRALDYTAPIHVEFGDYLSALITADSEIRADDSRYQLRESLLESFRGFGIAPASGTKNGLWQRSDIQLGHEGVRFGSLQSDPIEMFRLVWANRKVLRLDPTAYTRIASIRPCIRTSPDDGLPLRETVAECLQYVEIAAAELDGYGLAKPASMPDETEIRLEAGSTLILDEYGRLKYEIYNRLPNARSGEGIAKAQARLDYLWEHGYLGKGSSFALRLATMHRLRAGHASLGSEETW